MEEWKHWPEGECKHIIANDYQRGVQVCLSCGFVFDVQLYGEEVLSPTCPPTSAWQRQHPLLRDGGPRRGHGRRRRHQAHQQERGRGEGGDNNAGYYYYDFPYDMIVREFLMDTLAPIHMNLGFLVDTIVGQLYNIAIEDGRSIYGRLNLSKPRDRVLSAYVPRLAHELCLPQWCISGVEEACWHAAEGSLYLSTAPPEQEVGAILYALGLLLETDMIGMVHLLTLDKIAAVVGCQPGRIKQLRDRLCVSIRIALIEAVYRNAKKRHISLPHLGCFLAQHQAAELAKRKLQADQQ